MNRALLVVAGASALLAGCGKNEKDAINASAPMSQEQVAAEVSKVKMKPGQWESSFALDDVAFTNMPKGAPSSDQMKGQMKAAMSRSAIKHCVTPEQAANPSADLLSGQKDQSCTYKGFDMAGGTIRGQISCGKNGQAMTATMTGNYAPDRYDVTMDMTTKGGTDGVAMTMKAHTKGKWLGDQCTADEAKPAPAAR